MRLLAILIIVLYPTSLFGESEECSEQNYDNVEEQPDFACPGPGENSMVPDYAPPDSIPVVMDEYLVAPWDGAFVHVNRLLEIGMRLKAVRRLRWADRARLLQHKRLEIEHAALMAAAHREYAVNRMEQYRKALREANNRTKQATAWYRSWAFGFLLGALSVGIVAALAIYAGVAL